MRYIGEESVVCMIICKQVGLPEYYNPSFNNIRAVNQVPCSFAIECECDNWRTILLPVTLFHGSLPASPRTGILAATVTSDRKKDHFTRANKKLQPTLYRRTARPSIDVRTSMNVRASNGGQPWPDDHYDLITSSMLTLSVETCICHSVPITSLPMAWCPRWQQSRQIALHWLDKRYRE